MSNETLPENEFAESEARSIPTEIVVAPPDIVRVLVFVGWTLIVGAPVVLLLNAEHFRAVLPAIVMLAVGGVVTLGLAKLIECAHESARRLARLELLFQRGANERK